MYKSQKDHQVSFFDFNQTCGINLDPDNEWVLLASRLDWDQIEVRYSELFPSKTGCPAKSARIALGALIIQKIKHLSDRALCKEIAENPYLQYFLGLKQFSNACPFTAPALVSFRKRFSLEFLNEINENYLVAADCTAEHRDEKTSTTAGDTNCGTAILDATCSPQNIKYPQDFELLNQAREFLESLIDYFHKTFRPWSKPRTYRIVLRKAYLALAKRKHRTEKDIRALIHKLLESVKRDLSYVDRYTHAGYEIPAKWVAKYETIQQLYQQQKYMYDNKTHRVENRIVSISQPYVRPIVRGKAKNPVEFGSKYDICVDEKGHAHLEKISFDPYNENTIFQDAIERYKARAGHYPERVLVDQIYRTKENRAYCKEHNIRMSGPKLGRPSQNQSVHHADKAIEKQDNADRIEVERFFSLEKRCYGAGLIMTKLLETSLASVCLSILVANLLTTVRSSLFLLYLMDDGQTYGEQFFIQFEPLIEGQA